MPASFYARLKSYADGISADFLKNINSWISKTLFAAFSGLVIILVTPINENYFQPLWAKIENYWSDRKEISQEEAMRLAKRFVGRSSVVAVPFHNQGDPNQYVAVWSEDAKNECSNVEGEFTCPYGGGALYLNLLIGEAESFENVATKVPAFPGHVNGETALNLPDLFIMNSGITDWNGDGYREILSIADQSAMTAPQRLEFVSLFDTKDRSVVQLKVTTPPGSSELSGSSDPKLRAWLLQRHNETQDWTMRECSRELGGTLSCKSREVDAESDEGQPEFDFVDGMIEDWISVNGTDFTTGPMEVQFRNMEVDLRNSQSLCVVTDKQYTVSSLFKGPVVIWTNDGKKAAVLYNQDNSHHREVPAIIAGKTYFWLGVAADESIIAIDKETFEAKAFAIQKWKSIFGDKDRYPDYDDTPTGKKDFQIENLSLDGQTLRIDDRAISLTDRDGAKVPAGEFSDAPWCSISQGSE